MRKLNELKQLELDRLDLVATIEESQRQFLFFENSKQVLDKLLAEHNFDVEMQKLGYPAKVLKGKINLENDSQRVAIDELSITLGVKSDFPEALTKIITALKLYYKFYFQSGHPCQEVDTKTTEALKQFDADKNRGANPDFLLYQKSQELLAKANHSEINFRDIDNLEQGDFSLVLFAEWMVKSKNNDFLHHLLKLGKWDVSHLKLLEHSYEKSDHSDFAKACLEKIIEIEEEPTSYFLDHQLELDHHPEWIREFLGTLNDKQLEKRLEEALDQNLHHLLSALINLKGLDQKYFYQILGKPGLRTSVFKHIVNSLFKQTHAQGVYGMDHNYAKQVLTKQRHSPANVITTLQKALPHGFRGTQIQDFFIFLNTINQQLKTALKVKEKLESLGNKDSEHGRNSLAISDHQTIRFLLFYYIYDRINTLHTNFKVLGLSSDQLRDFIEMQYQFELKWGKNRDILSYIQNIRQKHPILKMSAAETNS